MQTIFHILNSHTTDTITAFMDEYALAQMTLRRRSISHKAANTFL